MAQITLNSTGVASNGALVLQSNGTTTAVTINASQGVEFNAGTAALPAITTTGDTNTGIFFPAADTIGFTEGGVEAMRIDSSGNLGLGVTPSAWATSGTILKAFQIGAAGSVAAGTVDASLQMSQNAYFDGSSWRYIQTATAGNYYISGNTHNWRIAPSGTAGNPITFTQAMTLDASGNLLVGNTVSAYATDRLSIDIGASNATGLGIAYGNVNKIGIGIYNGYTATGTATAVQFQDHNSVVRGSITVTTSGTLYNLTSDQRLKENIVDSPEFGGVIDSIQVRSFDWKTSNTHQRSGFIAQELVTVFPEAVHQPEDSEEMMAVDYSKLVPMLVKEIQSLRARVAQLETN